MTATDADRFTFGDNWRSFLDTLDDQRVQQAVESMRRVLGTDTLHGKTFLDVGSGSGLFSLAAWTLGAAVRSFDYDRQSVACTLRLRDKFTNGSRWVIEQGSALDAKFLHTLGTFDIVYSWGVLHHTGDMWSALGNMPDLVSSHGDLVVSIYNDQGMSSRAWKAIKRTYNRLPEPLRPLYAIAAVAPSEIKQVIALTINGQFSAVPKTWSEYGSRNGRGMSRWHDIVDWVGGYPFEVAGPDAVFEFFRDRGFSLEHMVTQRGGIGCNEFRFRRLA